jgi:phage shock protein PspC (stress-responsive transcriptional regulator)
MTTNVTKPTPLPLRNDTLLGVCEAIGQDFGFNPLWLRLAFIAPLFVAPVATVGVYLALGAVVATSRYFFPRIPASEQVVEATAKPVIEEERELPIAA